MADLPLISVIIPTRHRLALLRRAVASVNNQDYGNFELIVVDNAADQPLAANDISTTAPLRIVRSSKMLPIPASRNLGIKHASGDIITFLDDDDEILPGKFTTQASALADHPEVDFVYSATRHIGPNGETLTVSSGPPEMTPFLKWRYVHTNALAIRRRIVESFLFNEQMTCFEDVEFVGRLIRRVKGMHIPEIHAIWYRDNRPDQITRKNWRRSYENWRILCDQFETEIMADHGVRRLYYRKMFALAAMFADTPRALRSLARAL